MRTDNSNRHDGVVKCRWPEREIWPMRLRWGNPSQRKYANHQRGRLSVLLQAVNVRSSCQLLNSGQILASTKYEHGLSITNPVYVIINLYNGSTNNKYRGGTSNATTSSSLIVLLSFDGRSKTTWDRRTDPWTDGPTDGQTRPLKEMRSRI